MAKISFILLATLLAQASSASALVESAKCATKDSCLNDQNCQCYCSGIGSFRDKVANDAPVFLEQDKNGEHCYCKAWDLDKYPGPAKR